MKFGRTLRSPQMNASTPEVVGLEVDFDRDGPHQPPRIRPRLEPKGRRFEASAHGQHRDDRRRETYAALTFRRQKNALDLTYMSRRSVRARTLDCHGELVGPPTDNGDGTESSPSATSSRADSATTRPSYRLRVLTPEALKGKAATELKLNRGGDRARSSSRSLRCPFPRFSGSGTHEGRRRRTGPAPLEQGPAKDQGFVAAVAFAELRDVVIAIEFLVHAEFTELDDPEQCSRAPPKYRTNPSNSPAGGPP